MYFCLKKQETQVKEFIWPGNFNRNFFFKLLINKHNMNIV